MVNDKPFIKVFETNKRYYLYDVNKNEIQNINHEQYEILKDVINGRLVNYRDNEKLKKLLENGCLSNNRAKEIEHPYSELISFYLDNNIKMLTLQVTQSCNFRCEYCIYSGNYLNRQHTSKRMTEEVAFKAIDFLIDHSRNNKEICVAFYGGEPLLEFNLVKKCIAYAEEKAEGKELSFSMTTNGWLLTDDVTKFLCEHDVNLTISLDGPEEIQDSHRKVAFNNDGSFKQVILNIKNLKDKYPDYMRRISFNAVIDPLNDFSKIDEFFNCNNIVKDIQVGSTIISNNYKKDTNIDKRIDKKYEEHFMKQEYELFRIFYYLIRKKNTDKCSRIVKEQYNIILDFSRRIKPQSNILEKAHPSGQCVPGVDRLFVNAYGDFFPCERVSECSELMKIGNIDTGFDVDNVKKILNLGKVNSEACKNCWAFRFCTICAAVVDNTEKDFSPKKKEQCCKEVKQYIEEKLKNYCFLKEFGHDFENEKINIFNE